MNVLGQALLVTGVSVLILGLGAVGSVAILPPIPDDDPGPAKKHAAKLHATGIRGMVAGAALVAAGLLLIVIS